MSDADSCPACAAVPRPACSASHPQPEELEAYRNPAPGLYGEGGVPRNPEWEWKKDSGQAVRRSASFVKVLRSDTPALHRPPVSA